ncbi:MAG: hypothetical protein IJZ84_01540 [Lachnospiraceae bacterium]|nr:hypothetical protein [Lachnospiraceae bacterium]
MAFCENCGKQLQDGEKCTCTESVEQVTENTGTVEQVSESAEAEAPKRENPLKGKEKPLIIAAAAVVVLLILIKIFSGSKGYMEPINDFMKAINKKNTSSVELNATLMPDFGAKLYKKYYAKQLKSDYYADVYDDRKDDFEDYYDDCDDEYDRWKLSFEMKKSTKLDKDDLEDIQDELDDYYDDYLEYYVDSYEDILDDEDDLEEFADSWEYEEKDATAALKAFMNFCKAYEELKVTAGYEVKGKFIVKSGKDEYKTDTVEFIVLKVNGDWTYYGVTGGGSLYFEDDEEGCFDFISNFLYSSKLSLY